MKKNQFHHMKVEIPDNNGNIKMVSYRDILYIIYDKPYTSFVYTKKEKTKKKNLLTSLVGMEQQLPIVFFRCNPTTILNLCYFKEYIYKEKKILMEDGRTFNLSRRKRCKFQAKLASLPRLSPLCNPCLVCTNACPTRESFCAREKSDRIAPENNQTE